MRVRTSGRRLRLPATKWLGTAAAAGAVAGLGLASLPAQSATRPTIAVTNDADGNGTYTASESVPKNTKLPLTVNYRLAITTATNPMKVASITDDQTSDVGTCASLVGTTLAGNVTVTCSYSVTYNGPPGGSVTNTAKLVYDNGGKDVATSSSTVSFANVKAKCNSGNGNGSDYIQFDDPNAHCYGGDPGNSYNAGNKGGDEIPTSGGNPNPGGNNVP